MKQEVNTFYEIAILFIVIISLYEFSPDRQRSLSDNKSPDRHRSLSDNKSLSAFFYFLSMIRRNGKIHKKDKFFSYQFTPGLTFWSGLGDSFEKISLVSFSKRDSGLCIYHSLIWSNSNLLHNYLWITFPTQSWLLLSSFCASLLHSLMFVIYPTGEQ